MLALARRLMPAAPALLAACWWAVLPTNFDALYEVHLFATPFLLGTALLLTDDPGPWRRGWALALALLATLLVRNETVFVLVLLVVGLAFATRGRRWPLAATAVPLLVVVLIAGLAYSRGVEKDGALRTRLEHRQKTALCQHFAINYEQRHTDVKLNPFLSCRVLMKQTFGEEHPSFTTAWSENARAMAAFTAWHARLVPNGLQLGLFQAVWDHENPDFVAADVGRGYAGVLSLLLLALLVAGGRALWLDRAEWGDELRRQRLAWLALAAIGLGTLITCTFFVRPRPSFIFGLSAVVMLAAGLALSALARRYRLERVTAIAAIAVPVLLLALLPVHYKPQSTPLADAYHRLRPFRDRIGTGERFAMAPVAFGDDICFYLRPVRSCHVLNYFTIQTPDPARGLDAAGIKLLYADPTLAANPAVARFIARPGRGWRVARSGVDQGRPWAVLVRS
ncbi:MAG: hypothetical protein ACJ766_07145 [Thermoleophilaceae bacterium]